MNTNDVILQSLRKEVFTSFDKIITSYTKVICETRFNLLPNVMKKICTNLIKNLRSIAEKTLQYELDEQSRYGSFSLEKFSEEKTSESLTHKYLYLSEILERRVKYMSKYLFRIDKFFIKDRNEIVYSFNLKVEPNTLKIVDIDVSLGDEHNGEGTALVTLSDGTRLIYKPRNCSITKSYNLFIDWISVKLQVELATFDVLDCGDYAWIEFVSNDEISTEKEIQEYYYKAGILLAATYLLGSKDYHIENVIASKKGPIIIDHETIIQPLLKNSFPNSWYEIHGIPPFSVLESSLIAEPNKGIPASMVGYGVNDFDKRTAKSTTTQPKLSSCDINHGFIRNNIPKYKGEYVFANHYKDYFVDGFNIAYDMFLDSREELNSNESPIASFNINEVRFVWRPTAIYAKILRYLENPCYLTSYEAYRSKLFELLSKAYKKEHMRPYEGILNYEMEQMLNGDIPIFHLNSHERYLGGDEKLNVFEYSSLENIYHRISLLSAAHKEEQLGYIAKWLNY